MTTRMDPTIKARWVAALRSGEYKQARNTLRRADEFCCMGVLCDLNDPSKWDSDWRHGGSNQLPTAEVYEWAGFSKNEYGYFRPAMVRINGKEDNLDSHNDSGRTFAEIADAIEAQL